MAGELIERGDDEGEQQSVESRGSTKVFEFLKLPAEIRNMIYLKAVFHNATCYCHFVFQPPLTLVNKQIRSESLPVLYGNTNFMIHFGTGPSCEYLYKLYLLHEVCAAPSPASTVSAISALAHVTKLNIRFTFSKLWQSEGDRRVNLRIFMRENNSDYRQWSNNCIVGQSGFEWKDRATIEAAYRDLVSKVLDHRPHYSLEKKLVYGGMASVVQCVLLFAEKCPLAAEWAWMTLEAHTYGCIG